MHQRLIASDRADAAALIDISVYTPRRLFRLLGSTKLSDPSSRPIGAQAPSTADVLSSLVVPVMQPAAAPPLRMLIARAPTVRKPADAHVQNALRRPRASTEAPPCKVSRLDQSCSGSNAPVGRWWGHQTEMPLLDMPRLPHPALWRRCGSCASIPAAFAPLVHWGAAKLHDLGGGSLASWRLEHATHPAEVLLHLTGTERGVCSHLGRAHQSQHIMFTLDLLNGLAWQRCWDQRCVRTLPIGYVKAKTPVGSVPSSLLPTASVLQSMF